MSIEKFTSSFDHEVTGPFGQEETYQVFYGAIVDTGYCSIDFNRYDLDGYEKITRKSDGVDILNDLQLLGSIDYFEDLCYSHMRQNDPFGYDEEKPERFGRISTVFEFKPL